MIIPSMQPNTVESTVLPAPQRSLDDPVARAAERLGQTGERVAGQTAQYANELKYKADVSRVDKLMADENNELISTMHGPVDPDNPDSGFLSTLGDQSRGITGRGMDAYGKIHQKYSDQITDSQQRNLYDHQTRHIEAQTRLELERHEFIQTQKADFTNKQAKIDSMEQKLSLMANGTAQELKPFMDAYLYEVSELMKMKGFDLESDETQKALSNARTVVYAHQVDQLAQTDPLAAEQRLNTESEKNNITKGFINIDPDVVQKLRTELKPRIEAYKVDSVIQQISKLFPKDASQPFKIDEYMTEARKLEKDPKTLKDIHATLKQAESDRNDEIDKQGKSLEAHVLKGAHNSWDKYQEVNVNNIKKTPEYAKLTEQQQVKLLDRVELDNWKIHSHNQTLTSQKQKGLEGEQIKNFNYYSAHPDELAQLTPEQLIALNLGHSDFKTLAATRKKLTTPEAITKQRFEADDISDLLTKAGITEPAEVRHLTAAAGQYIKAEEKKQGRLLTPKEMLDVVIQAVQTNVHVKEPGRFYGTNVVQKRRIEVRNKADIIDEASGAGQKYKTADDVRDAYHKGDITREAASKILNSQFGYK